MWAQGACFGGGGLDGVFQAETTCQVGRKVPRARRHWRQLRRTHRELHPPEIRPLFDSHWASSSRSDDDEEGAAAADDDDGESSAAAPRQQQRKGARERRRQEQDEERRQLLERQQQLEEQLRALTSDNERLEADRREMGRRLGEYCATVAKVGAVGCRTEDCRQCCQLFLLLHFRLMPAVAPGSTWRHPATGLKSTGMTPRCHRLRPAAGGRGVVGRAARAAAGGRD